MDSSMSIRRLNVSQRQAFFGDLQPGTNYHTFLSAGNAVGTSETISVLNGIRTDEESELQPYVNGSVMYTSNKLGTLISDKKDKSMAKSAISIPKS